MGRTSKKEERNPEKVQEKVGQGMGVIWGDGEELGHDGASENQSREKGKGWGESVNQGGSPGSIRETEPQTPVFSQKKVYGCADCGPSFSWRRNWT